MLYAANHTKGFGYSDAHQQQCFSQIGRMSWQCWNSLIKAVNTLTLLLYRGIKTNEGIRLFF